MTAPAPSTALDDQLCFSLYAASRAAIAGYRPMLVSMGITYPQLLVLMALWDHDGPLSVREISDRLGLDSATVSPLLKRMGALGLITTQRDATDERRLCVEITELGRDLRQPACDLSQMMIDTLGMSGDQLGALKAQLDVITEKVTRST